MAYVEPSGTSSRAWQGARYAYDAQGNRLRKATYAPTVSVPGEQRYAEAGTVHIRDAAGEVLATYTTERSYAVEGEAEGEVE